MTKLRRRIRELVRQFKENGPKLLLEHPANVRDVLTLVHLSWLDQIDFSRLEQIKTTFIRRDYRHLESDIVFTAPLAGPGRPRRNLLIYVLIEHQSEPDRLMPFRLADSQVQIFRYQVRKFSQTHRSLARVQLSPVLPVVIYTGVRRWSEVGNLADLIARGDEFRAVTPIVQEPLFLNLPELPQAQLERDGGYFGWVLRLVQQRRARAREFEDLLQRAVAHLEAIGPAQRQRWRDLLFYVGALVYHERSGSEQPQLQQRIESSIGSEEFRQEVVQMRKSMADIMMEKGAQKVAAQTRQQTLVRQLRRRFGDVPLRVVRVVESTADADRLDDWLDRLVTADTLDQLKIPLES